MGPHPGDRLEAVKAAVFRTPPPDFDEWLKQQARKN
jgi:hypothetical protein